MRTRKKSERWGELYESIAEDPGEDVEGPTIEAKVRWETERALRRIGRGDRAGNSMENRCVSSSKLQHM